jgi:hypothetical protein
MNKREASNWEVSVEATQTASNEHVEFDRLCEQVEEFDHLPAISPPVLEPEPEQSEEIEVDQLILAGLVSPV